jgi:hypothetical protein
MLGPLGIGNDTNKFNGLSHNGRAFLPAGSNFTIQQYCCEASVARGCGDGDQAPAMNTGYLAAVSACSVSPDYSFPLGFGSQDFHLSYV